MMMMTTKIGCIDGQGDGDSGMERLMLYILKGAMVRVCIYAGEQLGIADGVSRVLP